MKKANNLVQAKCESCGCVFTLGVDGVDRDGHDVCDKCANIQRPFPGGAVTYDPWNYIDELTDMEKA